MKLNETVVRDELEAISLIRAYANDNYEQGWSAVVEAWSDGDILEYLSNAEFNIVKTIWDIQDWINLRQEMSDNCQF